MKNYSRSILSTILVAGAISICSPNVQAANLNKSPLEHKMASDTTKMKKDKMKMEKKKMSKMKKDKMKMGKDTMSKM